MREIQGKLVLVLDSSACFELSSQSEVSSLDLLTAVFIDGAIALPQATVSTVR